MNNFLQTTLSEIDNHGLRRKLRTLKGAQGRKIIIDGGGQGPAEVLNFCSNNYLGLADDPRLKEAAIAAINEEGWGAGASRLVCGNMSAHTKLEEHLARFKGAERTLLFSTGYMANVGIISSLFDRESVIFSDRLNHASIIDGILLSQAKLKRYPHNDMEALAAMLKAAADSKRKVIITDSVFSMDGDVAPLERIVALAQQYDCLVMVDEAHALGVLGKTGKGALEHFGLEGKVDIQMGTLSKAAGSFGAYCAGSSELIDYLINCARSFIYTTGMPPSVAAASLKALEIIEEEPERRERLWANTEYFHRGLQQLGFDTAQSQTPIIPVIVKESALAMDFSRKLFEAGIFVSAIRPPTVPANTARLRVTVMATHKKEDLDFVLEQFQSIGRELCLI